MSAFDPTKPHETVFGFGFSLYRYTQGDCFYDNHFMRVNPKTGNAWTERDDEAIEEIQTMKDAGMEKAAELASEGVKLPTRLINTAKEVREALAESPKAPAASKTAKTKAKASK